MEGPGHPPAGLAPGPSTGATRRDGKRQRVRVEEVRAVARPLEGSGRFPRGDPTAGPPVPPAARETRRPAEFHGELSLLPYRGDGVSEADRRVLDPGRPRHGGGRRFRGPGPSGRSGRSRSRPGTGPGGRSVGRTLGTGGRRDGEGALLRGSDGRPDPPVLRPRPRGLLRWMPPARRSVNDRREDRPRARLPPLRSSRRTPEPRISAS